MNMCWGGIPLTKIEQVLTVDNVESVNALIKTPVWVLIDTSYREGKLYYVLGRIGELERDMKT